MESQAIKQILLLLHLNPRILAEKNPLILHDRRTGVLAELEHCARYYCCYSAVTASHIKLIWNVEKGSCIFISFNIGLVHPCDQ